MTPCDEQARIYVILCTLTWRTWWPPPLSPMITFTPRYKKILPRKQTRERMPAHLPSTILLLSRVLYRRLTLAYAGTDTPRSLCTRTIDPSPVCTGCTELEGPCIFPGPVCYLSPHSLQAQTSQRCSANAAWNVI